MKAPDKILAVGEIDAGLSSNCSIHLCQQRRRNLQDRDTAHEDGGEKSAEICDDATPESDHNTRAISTALQHLIGETLYLFKTFIGFTGRKKQDLRLCKTVF